MEGYWPGSPKQISHVFSEELFRLWDSVRKHMPGTSETAFLRAVGDISSERGRVGFDNNYVVSLVVLLYRHDN
jgi:hypothetical protein